MEPACHGAGPALRQAGGILLVLIIRNSLPAGTGHDPSVQHSQFIKFRTKPKDIAEHPNRAALLRAHELLKEERSDASKSRPKQFTILDLRNTINTKKNKMY